MKRVWRSSDLRALSAFIAISMFALAFSRGIALEQGPGTLSLTHSSQTLRTLTTLKTAYPQLKGFAAQKINAIYTSVPRAAPRPVFSPRFACKSGGLYTYDWDGTTPPNCTQTGTFYRRYTITARAAAEAIVELPSRDDSATALPFGADASATGYLYIEGWPGAYTSNSEGGLHYNAARHAYTPYLATPRLHETDANWNVLPGSTVLLRVGSDDNPADRPTIPSADAQRSCSVGCIYLIVAILKGPNCPVNTICIDRQLEISNSWKANCCIFGLMTTIARDQQFTFDGNFVFGPIKWTNPYTEKEYALMKYRYDGCAASAPAPKTPAPAPSASPAGNPCQSAAFSRGGAQLYPNSKTYVRITPVMPTGESVTIINP